MSITFVLWLLVLVLLSLYVMLMIHLSILERAAAILFRECFVSVRVSAPYVIGVVHLSLQADC